MSTVSEDITGGLLSRLQQDPKAKTILKKIKEGNGDYTDAEKYALRAGELLSEVFKANISAGNFPVGSVDEIASLIVPALELNHKAVSQVTGMVQRALNQDGNIGMNAVMPQFDRSGAYNLVGRMAKYDTFEDAEFLLDEPVKTSALNVTDETLRQNADFQYKSGLKPKIVRTAESDACDWCKELEGEYDYEEVKDRNNPVYQRHNNCVCEVTYIPGDGRAQDVHSKQWIDPEARHRRIILTNQMSSQWERQRQNSLQTYKIITSGKTDHIKERQRKNERNISDQAINSVIKHPLHKTGIMIDEKGRPFVKYIGEKITVIINPDNGTQVTVIRTPPSVRKKWKK